MGFTDIHTRKRRWIRKPRKRFNLTDMEDAKVFYNLSICLFYAQYYYYRGTNDVLREVMEKGWNYYDSIIDNIKALNRCFQKLIKDKEFYAALPLLRLQMDNLSVLYAEYLHPTKVLYPIMETGKGFGKIKVDGEYLKASSILEALDSQYGDLKEIWKETCGYVHPSKAREEASNLFYYSQKEGKYVTSKDMVNKYLKRMVRINQVILDVLNMQYDYFITKLKENGTYSEYYKSMQTML